MKTKHFIFGVIYAIMFIYFLSVGNGWAVFLTILLLLCDIVIIGLKKDFDKSKLEFEKTLTNRRVAYDKMYSQAMQLTEELKQKNEEIDLWKKGFYDLEEVLNGFEKSTNDLFEIIDERNSEIAELKPLAQQRLKYLQHERERKKTFRKENADLLKVRRFAKKHVGRIVKRKDGFDLNSSGEDTAMICGYDKNVDVLIISSTKGWTKVSEWDVVLKESGTGYDYIDLNSIKLVKK